MSNNPHHIFLQSSDGSSGLGAGSVVMQCSAVQCSAVQCSAVQCLPPDDGGHPCAAASAGGCLDAADAGQGQDWHGLPGGLHGQTDFHTACFLPIVF